MIIGSRFGLRLMTIREDEVAAEAMGISTFRHKLYVFLLSAIGPGIAGALTARDQGYIEPLSVFPLATTITMIVMTLFGGKGTVWSGRVLLDGERIEGLKPWQIARRGVGRTFQVIRVFPELTALENLLGVTTGPHEAAQARARDLLAFVKLEGLADEYAGNLSYGQQKLVEFVRMLMRDPSLILLDEPAAGVNRTLLNDLLDAVRRLRDQGKTVLLVEHDMKVVMGLCETVFVLDHGEKIAEGPPGVIQSDERVIEAYFGR